MAIDLPPGTAPALATAQEIQTYRNPALEATDGVTGDSLIRTQLAGYEALVIGNSLLTEDRVLAALASGNSLSDAIWQLHFTYLREGHRLTRIRYHLAGTQLFIRIIEGRISEIVGPEVLTRYFWEMEGRRFDLPQLESRRVLANLQAERSGLQVQSEYEPVDPSSESVRLRIKSEPDPDYAPRRYSLTLGNPGNRFVGRHFAQANATWDTSSAQWKLGLNKSISGLDEDENRDGRLWSYQLSASSIVPIGLVGAGFGGTDYSFRSLGSHFQAHVNQGQLLAQQILYSDLNRRSLISQRLLFVNSDIREDSSRTQVLDERYFAAELGLEYTVRHSIGDYKPVLKYEAGLRKGLSDNSGTLGRPVNGFIRDARFLLLRPTMEARLKLDTGWELSFQLESQFADREVPEQQQWLLGGPERLRAWLPGTLIGDNGHYLSLETRTPVYNYTRLRLTPTFFVEAGASRLKTGHPALSDWQRGYDAGVSLSAELGPHWQLTLTAAEPIGDSRLSPAVSGRNEASLFFSLKVDW